MTLPEHGMVRPACRRWSASCPRCSSSWSSSAPWPAASPPAPSS